MVAEVRPSWPEIQSESSPLRPLGRCWRSGFAFHFGEWLRAKVASEPRALDRDLRTLLGALGCSAANVVVISKAYGHESASPEAALEAALRMQDKWSADVGGRGILLSKAEPETLLGAGAEDKLPEHWYPCE